MDAVVNKYQAHDGALRKSRHMIIQAARQPTRLATTVRPRNGKVSISHGPAETKEQVVEFFLTEAWDLNEALLVASEYPAAHLGEHVGWGIAVRPIEVIEQP